MRRRTSLYQRQCFLNKKKEFSKVKKITCYGGERQCVALSTQGGLRKKQTPQTGERKRGTKGRCSLGNEITLRKDAWGCTSPILGRYKGFDRGIQKKSEKGYL